MSSSMHIDNKNNDILILGEDPTQELDGTTLKRECYKVNATKLYQLKAKGSKIKGYALFLGNISKDFTINNMKTKQNKTGWNSVDLNPIDDTNDILDIHKYLMKKKHDIKQCLR